MNKKKFDRNLLYKDETFNFIGTGKAGGKASSLILIKDTLDLNFTDNMFDKITVNIPHTTVILTDVFDLFMKKNKLYDIALSDYSDDMIGNAFQKADFAGFDCWRFTESYFQNACPSCDSFIKSFRR